MKERRVGLYLGTGSIGGVLLENKRIISLASFDLASLPEKADAETLSEELKWETLINKTLRQMQAEEKEIYLSIADRDFIFRSFEIPLMKRNEIESSIIYQMEQHIPFKVEELIWDYSFVRFPKEKKIDLSFLGMTQKNFQKFQQILSHLNLKALAIEPSSFSLIRVIKSQSNLAHLKNYAILDFSEQETYLTFYHHDLPIFSRYLPAFKREESTEYDKFIDAMRLSFKYFSREFKNYQFDRLAVISNYADEKISSFLRDELKIELDVLEPGRITQKENTTVESIKALGVASRDDYPYKFKPILMSRGEREKLKEVYEEGPVKMKFLVYLAGIGVFLSILVSSVLGGKLAARSEQYLRDKKLLFFPSVLEGLSEEKIKKRLSAEKVKVSLFKKLISPKDKISFLFEKIPSLLPQGLWLDNLRLFWEGEKYKSLISGYVFLKDSYKERLEIDRFVSNLKNDEEIKKVFSSIEMISAQRAKIKEFESTSFNIKLEGYAK